MFYVKGTEFSKISGRTKQALYAARNDGRLPYEEGPGGEFLYNIDEPKVRAIVKNIPETTADAKVRQTLAYRKEFQRQRVNQEVPCAKTGMLDYMSAADPETDDEPLNKSLDDAELDRRRKEVEIEYKEGQVEKIKVSLDALTGDLINRQFVRSYIEKYLGTFNQQALDFPYTGFVSELYDLFMREKDGTKAIREAEKRFEKKMSALIKDTTQAMKENPL